MFIIEKLTVHTLEDKKKKSVYHSSAHIWYQYLLWIYILEFKMF